MNWKASILVLLPAFWLSHLAYGDAYYPFQQLSQPQGIVASQSSMVAPGTSLQTVPGPLDGGSGYLFGYWTLNDQRIADNLGQAMTIASFTLFTNTTAIAWYFSATQDTNIDGISDYLQWRYYGSLTNGPVSDTEGDGFTFLDELTRGYSPVIADEIVDGGIMMRLSDVGTLRDEVQVKSYEIRSEPQGIVALQTGYVSNGTPVATPTITYGANNFGYWEVNGVRQADGAGAALPRLILPMTNDMVAIARFYAGGDSNGNGLDDWYEWYWFGNTNQTLASNPDSDGFTIAEEQVRGYSPVIADEIVDGGIMMRLSDVGTLRDEVQVKSYEIRSEPQGIVVLQTGYVSNGTPVATPTITYGANNFGYWEVNGVRQADGAGAALPRVVLLMTNDTVAIARFYAGGDSNGNGLDDWYEWYWFGHTNQTLASNPDSDGFTIAEEQVRGYSPVIADEIVDGGIMMRLSDVGTLRDEVQVKSYEIRSEPQGIVALQTGYVSNGTPVATPTITYGANNFGYWEVNGVRQADGAGAALPRLILPMTNDTVAIARFFSDVDGNNNGLKDWYEWYWFGNTNQSLTSNPDGDGFTIAEEQVRGYSPIITDTLADGGIMMRLSDVGTVGLSYYPRASQLLVNGTIQTGFMSMGGAQGALGISSNSAPALGDWNGDGVPDLVIGGANGQSRFYQNAGSPIVPNFIRDTLAESAMANLWANRSNVAPALGDWSGDGLADLAIGGSTNVITLVSSVGGFSNAAPERIISTLLVANAAQAIPALAHMPGNPRCDLYVLRDNGMVDYFANSGGQTQPFVSSNCVTNLLKSAVPNATGLAIADMNHDGYLDILVADKTGSIHEFCGGTNRTFIAFGPGFAGSYVGFANRLTLAAGDLFGTGDTDLVGGFAEGGLVYLKNPTKRLTISPPSVTVTAGQTAKFAALNGNGAATWSLVRNNSGGIIGVSTGTYQSGTNGGTMDTVEGVDASGLRGRAYVNVIGASEMASFGKAVVIAGGRDLADPVWLASDYIANKAYNVLRYKGYARENIQYLSFNPGRDVDGDGLANDMAGFTSLTNAAGTFTNWVGNANKLFVYLVDHGAATPDGAYFRLNTGENLTSAQLNAWLTSIQDQHGTEVVVVLDFCYAGRFLQDLAYAGPAKRVVIAATSPTELTYFLSGGYVSFSDLFLSGMMQGLDLDQSFQLAQSGMQAYQNPTLDDTGDGLYQNNVDGSITATIQIGATRLAGKDVPIIGAVAASQTLNAGTKATLWADSIQSYYPIERLYGTILPPSFSANTNAGVPVTGMSEVELTPDSAGRYQVDFDGFTEAGAYRINYYARDIWGSVSPPQPGLVIQSGFDERMIIVTGGSTNDGQWSATAKMSVTAYRTALARRLGKNRLYCLSGADSQDYDGDGTNDVIATPTLATLANAITNWASPASRLTVYLIGSTVSNGLYRLGSSETLSASQLDTWLDSFQQTNRSVNVVLDHDNSGGYVSALTPPTGQERIVMASTKAGGLSVRAAGGLVSFSQFFLNGILNGQSLGAAFGTARDVIRNASGLVRQTAQIDDTGNGLANEKNLDGLAARVRYLGGAFATGEDAPFIGAVTGSTNVVVNGSVLLWAQGILSGVGITNVWCVITPPDFNGAGDLPQADLTWNAALNRYEAVYAGFPIAGIYVCTFFAQDNSGQVSTPKQCELTATDAFEEDDLAQHASEFAVGMVQSHNFHLDRDEDWVKFYAPTGWIFEITAEQLGTNSDVALEVYLEQADGSLELADGIDDYGWGMGATETLTLDLKTGLGGLSAGIYYVRVSSADTNCFGLGSEYELRIHVPVGGSGGVVLLSSGGGLLPMGSFYVYLGSLPALAGGGGWRVQQLTNENYLSDSATVYTLPASPNYTLTFREVPGYQAPTNRPLVITADQTTSVLAYYLYTNQSPQALRPMLDTNGALQLTFSAHAGYRYAIEESTDLRGWVSLRTNQVPADGLLRFSPTNAPTAKQGFYRTRLLP